MHFTLSAEAFRNMIATARLVVTGKSTLPVLETLRCEVARDGLSLTVTATDLDLTLVQTIPLTEKGSHGVACIYLKSLGMIRPDKDTTVRIEADPFRDSEHDEGAGIRYTSGSYAARSFSRLFDPAQFPETPAPGPEEYTCPLSRRALDAIATATPFMSRDETRHVLNGVLVSPEDGGSVVATDGRRLIRLRTRATPVRCIFPARLCQTLARLKPAAAACAIESTTPDGWTESIGIRASLRMGTITLHANLVEGNFPNFRQVIPAESTSAVTFSDPAAVAAWLNSLPELEKSGSIRLEPRAPHHVDLVHETGRITATAYLQDNPPAITFNPRFLATALTAVNGTLYLTDGDSPGTLRGPSALVVLMPMRSQKTSAPAVNSGKPLETKSEG